MWTMDLGRPRRSLPGSPMAVPVARGRGKESAVAMGRRPKRTRRACCRGLSGRALGEEA